MGLQWGGGSAKSGVLLREYVRFNHYGVFYLQFLEVFTLRNLKVSVCKVDHFEIVQRKDVLPREYARLLCYGLLCLMFLKVFALRCFNNSASKSEHFSKSH